jgi:hypothetical protein
MIMDYVKIYDQFIKQAQNRTLSEDGTAVHLHRIIPRCMGGDDSKQNLILVTFREHVFCHLLLAKIYPSNTAILKTAKAMSSRLSNHKKGINRNMWVSKILTKRDKSILEKIAKCKPYSSYVRGKNIYG